MRHRFNPNTLLALLTLGVVIAGCGTGIVPAPAPNPPGPESLKGIWKVQSGKNLLNDGNNYEMFNLQYIEMQEGNIATMFCKDPGTEIVYCIEGDYSTEEQSALRFTVDINGLDGFPFVFEFNGDDALRLIDEFGNAIEFSRETEIPVEERCGEMAVKNAFEFNVRPHELSGLAFDGDFLYFTDQTDKLRQRVDPNTGDLAEPLPRQGDYRYVQAAQGPTLWGLCNCYTFAGLRRQNLDGTEVTHFDLADNYGYGNVRVTSVAFDDPTQILWVSSRYGDLLGVDTEGEEPLIVAEFDFPGLDGLASDGTSLFGIINAYELIVEIDTTSGRALGTWKLPSDDVEWRGIDFAGDRLMVLADDEVNNVGLLYELAPVIEATALNSPLPTSP